MNNAACTGNKVSIGQTEETAAHSPVKWISAFSSVRKLLLAACCCCFEPMFFGCFSLSTERGKRALFLDNDMDYTVVAELSGGARMSCVLRMHWHKRGRIDPSCNTDQGV